MLTYLFAGLAACANAASSVLQRKANSAESTEDNLSLRLIGNLLRNPIWFAGILGVIAGFLLQAAALSNGALSVVEPILVFELPATLLLGSVVFHRRLHTREWTAALAITIGLAGLLYFLSPSAAPRATLSWWSWIIGIGINLALIAALVLAKAMTTVLGARGFLAIFTTWQTYAMIVAGGLAMFLLQSALNAGTLVAAQPGITAADPVVSILWGTLGFGETVRGGLFLGLAALCAAVIGAAVYLLSRSPLVVDEKDDPHTNPAAVNPAGAGSEGQG